MPTASRGVQTRSEARQAVAGREHNGPTFIEFQIAEGAKTPTSDGALRCSAARMIRRPKRQ